MLLQMLSTPQAADLSGSNNIPFSGLSNQEVGSMYFEF